MALVQELDKAAEQFVQGALNWDQPKVGEPVFTIIEWSGWPNKNETGYEFAKEGGDDYTVFTWKKHNHWSLLPLRDWLGAIATMTEGDASDQTVDELAHLVTDKLIELGAQDG